ncbi:hypothetical protein [Burkholderia pyrrocinia]|uniref:hypothetical protein n=1 Tax=Burkholderia pyrrocinia TaxID=60550 RepID=UPI000B6B0AAC|nr:hypothetical protein BZY94_39460 [Burkholderia territorii]HDR9503576.1 hypothetical protein [Burkholderia cepacia]
MSVARNFTRGQWEALGRRLDALPEKARDTQSVKVGDGVRAIWTEIMAAREKGYALHELIEQAAKEGIDVNLNSLRYAMRRADGKGGTRRGNRDTAREQATAPARGRKSARADASRDNPPRPGFQQKENTGTTRPEQQVQGFLGFPISPDTENL